MIRIKKHSNSSEYVLTDRGLWVRNFVKGGQFIDINKLTSHNDYNLLVENETNNMLFDLPNIDAEIVDLRDIAIVSDGYNFKKYEELLAKIPEHVAVIGTNRSLAKWSGVRKMDYFLTNNPYQECLSLIPPHRYYPKCIVSSRTNSQFIKHYKRQNVVYKYTPVIEERFAPVTHQPLYQIDDYRNPICAAIGLAYRFGVENLMLFCCDDAFEGERPSAEQLKNGLWMYPQHWISHELIEANLFWLTRQELTKVNIGSFSHGPEFRGIHQLTEEDVERFF